MPAKIQRLPDGDMTSEERYTWFIVEYGQHIGGGHWVRDYEVHSSREECDGSAVALSKKPAVDKVVVYRLVSDGISDRHEVAVYVRENPRLNEDVLGTLPKQEG